MWVQPQSGFESRPSQATVRQDAYASSGTSDAPSACIGCKLNEANGLHGENVDLGALCKKACVGLH